MDSRSEKLKEIILRQYPSIRAFARETGIAHGTLVSALNNGIDGMAWSKLNQICKFLQIDAESLEPLTRMENSEDKSTAEGEVDNRNRFLAYYHILNSTGQAKVEDYVKDLARISAYARDSQKSPIPEDNK